MAVAQNLLRAPGRRSGVASAFDSAPCRHRSKIARRIPGCRLRSCAASTSGLALSLHVGGGLVPAIRVCDNPVPDGHQACRARYRSLLLDRARRRWSADPGTGRQNRRSGVGRAGLALTGSSVAAMGRKPLPECSSCGSDAAHPSDGPLPPPGQDAPRSCPGNPPRNALSKPVLSLGNAGTVRRTSPLQRAYCIGFLPLTRCFF